MKAAFPLLLFFALPLFGFEDDCASEFTRLGTLYQLRSLMADSDTTPSDVQRFAERRIDSEMERIVRRAVRQGLAQRLQ